MRKAETETERETGAKSEHKDETHALEKNVVKEGVVRAKNEFDGNCYQDKTTTTQKRPVLDTPHSGESG